ncbi:hypothetical protein SAMN04515668_0131 [Hymenobacter arizonensis]|uniref:Lipocalin-like domain-containing protein n=1 Tax=Hymenobacter arizonensis TaxID=1227077 RepID=A0A1I5SPC7_HYMAR|nr:hypothetical protein SAMN04515668_0131 [Hymenobacter arizonensis]
MKKNLLLLLFCIGLTACKKGQDPSAPSKTELLTTNNWRLAASTVVSVSKGVSTTVDAYATIPACERDNFIRFRPDQSMVYDEGPTTCNPTFSQTVTSSWNWADNERTLALGTHIVGATVPYEVIEFTAGTLRLRYTLRQYFGGTDSSTEERTYQAF